MTMSEEISLGLIYRSARGRPIDKDNVARLAESIEQVGLLNPICVRKVVRHKGPSATFGAYEIVGGNHRYEVAKALRWETVACTVVEMDDLHAELAEIDENLMRAGLSRAQEAAAIFRRKAIYEELYPETKAGVAGANARWKSDDANEKPAFASATSEATGKSRRSVEIAVARGKALGRDLKAIAGTSLDRGVELDALARLPDSEREALIERAVAGEIVSARAPRSEPDVDRAPELELPTPDNQTTAGEQEIDSPLTTDEWSILGSFLRKLVDDYHADSVENGDYSSDEMQRIEEYNRVHGARIFGQESLELWLPDWAFDLWQRQFLAFQKAEAKAARRKGRSR